MTLKEALWTSLASMVTGILLGSFTLLPSPINAVVSLLGIILVIWFFKKFDKKSVRISFIIFTVLYFILFIFILSAYIFMTNPPEGLS
ncbi:hypothetical protein PUW24_25665 [Paenibacillus urinalis]|uniref:Uncharacterized protein n=1 Tax=Paenibacillus urinalis TaxID=521520 RepID=A0ABY7X6G7_9BACL|nr:MULTISPECIES: hypothetical protein [Paenibacillus]OMC68862.1 hypothetical protein BK126_13760 [Paenibacillus sp. FSL H7-0326]WDH97471.1 hypothetical protein PUW24_25665 [Paenibacillus urinalis]WDI01138.1 hypothetical protein PUW25_17905 [Paenibacillus urinalis]SDX11045.1 hypothetical protein SAMN05518848_104480 [Paenibacillus sp. PDC88]GAK39808.1 hypothetical protein TCA2_2297 [Paenibacillus sp. TCA20]